MEERSQLMSGDYDTVMDWAREYGCTFKGCDSNDDAWMLIERNGRSVEDGLAYDEVGILCAFHTKMMADPKLGGVRFPAKKVAFVKVGSKRIDP